jgi:hypothetical protein
VQDLTLSIYKAKHPLKANVYFKIHGHFNLQVPLQDYSVDEEVPNILPNVQELAEKDRDVFQKGTKAFVSFIQAYSKQECYLIFRSKGEPIVYQYFTV